jgi:hypothetical protein
MHVTETRAVSNSLLECHLGSARAADECRRRMVSRARQDALRYRAAAGAMDGGRRRELVQVEQLITFALAPLRAEIDVLRSELTAFTCDLPDAVRYLVHTLATEDRRNGTHATCR